MCAPVSATTDRRAKASIVLQYTQDLNEACALGSDPEIGTAAMPDQPAYIVVPQLCSPKDARKRKPY